jgi:hypothetical protein
VVPSGVGATVVAMITHAPDPGRSVLPFTLRTRVDDVTVRSLNLVAAARGCSVSQVVRDMVVAALNDFAAADGERLVDVVAREPDLGQADELADVDGLELEELLEEARAAA